MKNIDKTYILILNEKHGDEYFLFSSVEELNKLCIHLVKRNYDQYYFNSIEKRYNFTLPEGLTEDTDIDTLPKYAQPGAAEAISQYKRYMREYEEEIYQKGLADAALEGDANAAKLLITLRRDYEYEGYEVKIPTTCDNLE